VSAPEIGRQVNKGKYTVRVRFGSAGFWRRTGGRGVVGIRGVKRGRGGTLRIDGGGAGRGGKQLRLTDRLVCWERRVAKFGRKIEEG